MNHDRPLDRDDFEPRIAGHGHINGNGNKVTWWIMSVLGLIIATFAVGSWMSLESKVDALGKQMSAMDAKMTLLLDGRIREPPNERP